MSISKFLSTAAAFSLVSFFVSNDSSAATLRIQFPGKAKTREEAEKLCADLKVDEKKWELASSGGVLAALIQTQDSEKFTYVLQNATDVKENKGPKTYLFFASDMKKEKYGPRFVATLSDGRGTEIELANLDKLIDLKSKVAALQIVSDKVAGEVQAYVTWEILKNGVDFNTGKPLPPEEVGPEPKLSAEAKAIVDAKKPFTTQARVDWITNHVVPTVSEGIKVVCQEVVPRANN